MSEYCLECKRELPHLMYDGLCPDCWEADWVYRHNALEEQRSESHE